MHVHRRAFREHSLYMNCVGVGVEAFVLGLVAIFTRLLGLALHAWPA